MAGYVSEAARVAFWEGIKGLAGDPDIQMDLLAGRAELLMRGDRARGIAVHDPENALAQLERDCTSPDGLRVVSLSLLRRAVAAALGKMHTGIGYSLEGDATRLYDNRLGTIVIPTSPSRHSEELFGEIAGWEENPRIGFGIHDLDHACGGFYPGEVMGLVGAPGSMKTSLALNMCDQALRNTNGRALFFSLDMSARQISMRLLQRELDCFKADVVAMVKRGDPALREANRRLKQAIGGRLFVAGQRRDGTDFVWENMREIIVQTAPDLVVIDYVQLIGGYRDDRELLFGVLPKIVSAAGGFGLRFLLLSQMGRTSRMDQKNKLGDHAAGGYYFNARVDIEVELYSERDEYGSSHIVAGVTKTRNGAAGRCFDIEYSPRTLAFTGKSREVRRAGKTSKVFEI